MSIYYRFAAPIELAVRAFAVLPRPVAKVFYDASKPFQALPFVLLRFLAVRKLALSCGRNVFVGSHVEVRFFENLRIGDDVSIQNGCYLDARGGISLGSDISIAHGCSLVSFDHGYDDLSLPIRKNPYLLAEIAIEDDVWVGAGARLLSGARVGGRCIVGAGSVVTKRTETASHAIVAGVPARVVRRDIGLAPAH